MEELYSFGINVTQTVGHLDISTGHLSVSVKAEKINGLLFSYVLNKECPCWWCMRRDHYER